VSADTVSDFISQDLLSAGVPLPLIYHNIRRCCVKPNMVDARISINGRARSNDP
jgi:hypothetical protein